MNDSISRQAAIDALSAVNDSICGQQAIDALCELPSAQPEQRWIPRSSTERPKDREEVMVTIDDGYQRYTDTDEYVNGHFWYHDDKHIVAWMPLPKPYKEKDNERA